MSQKSWMTIPSKCTGVQHLILDWENQKITIIDENGSYERFKLNTTKAESEYIEGDSYIEGRQGRWKEAHPTGKRSMTISYEGIESERSITINYEDIKSDG